MRFRSLFFRTNWEKEKDKAIYSEKEEKGFDIGEMKESVLGGSGVGYIGRDCGAAADKIFLFFFFF